MREPVAAGHVIEAFGQFVVGGNYAVGIVVFAILTIINFVVVTKGAGRISEVSARFTLDAMPGKQMAIDSDLNAGLINQDEARTRRQEVRSEADFYGAMDGASKFVRGDATAGILILVINIVGGLAIGVLSHGLGFTDAARVYTLLTIGDGLVAQIPALLLSTGVAIIVTRMSRAQDLGGELSRQLFRQPRSAGGSRRSARCHGFDSRHAQRCVPVIRWCLGAGAWWLKRRARQAQEASAAPAPVIAPVNRRTERAVVG